MKTAAIPPLLLAITACSSGPCESSFKDQAIALTTLPKQYHQEAAAQVLANECELPEALSSTLKQLSSAPPGMRPMLESKIAVDAPELWTAACAGGHDALAASLQMPREEGRKHLYEACGVAELGFASEEEFAKASSVVTPLIVSALLADAPAMETRFVVRGLAGLPLN